MSFRRGRTQLILHQILYTIDNLMLTIHTRDAIIGILASIEIPVVKYTLDTMGRSSSTSLQEMDWGVTMSLASIATRMVLCGGVGIVLADVTGKSVKAAMVAALADGMLSEAINAQREFWDSPSKILRRLSIGIRPRLIRGMYAAMSLGIVRVEEKQLVFSNAGMPYPIVKRDKEVWELEVNGMPLGLMDKAEYQDMSLDVEEGDFVVFYSDGVIEAENETEEMYQTERLLEVVQEMSPALSAQEMVDAIIRDVTVFVGGEESSDDITIVVLRCVRSNKECGSG